MYVFKQLVGTIAAPLLLALLLAIVALVLLTLRWQRTARWLLIVAVAIAWLGALPITGDTLISPLERRYAPLDADRLNVLTTHVVVLGSSYTPGDRIPVTAALDDEGLSRAVEGIVLFRKLHATRLVLSGGAPAGALPSAKGYALLALSLGIDEQSLVVLDQSLDTDDEARSIHAVLGASPFVLVTSAYHMPRAVQLMERAGAHPIPAPTAQRVVPRPGSQVRRWLPSSHGLRKTELALHEYLGLLAIRLGVDD